MIKLSVIIYVALAVTLLILISHKPDTHRHHHRHRLKLRSTFKFSNSNSHQSHENVAFDPLVADLERRREDKQWELRHIEHAHPDILSHGNESSPGHEAQPEWEDFMDAEDYLNDEEKFNITSRLLLLFPKIDVDPADGHVTEHELIKWNLDQAEKVVMHRTQREMDVHDKNHDGLISFAEYEPPLWVRNYDNNSLGYEIGWWKEEHFNASDTDGDGFLNITEFNDFLHPADSKNPKLLTWLCQEEVRERDTDKDGKIGFDEFFHGVFDLVQSREGDEDHDSSRASEEQRKSSAKALFDQLDKDRDGSLSDVELLPVIGKIHPTEHFYAKQQANYMVSQADTNKDGRLSLTEMIENPYVFYNVVFSDEDEDDYDFHDEFR